MATVNVNLQIDNSLFDAQLGDIQRLVATTAAPDQALEEFADEIWRMIDDGGVQFKQIGSMIRPMLSAEIGAALWRFRSLHGLKPPDRSEVA